MNDNSYNVCSRCGSANPLTARYCYQCGFELKSADSPVLCSKCNTLNSASANFCKRCGSKLAKGDAKIMCPHCGFSNNAESDFCTNCGLDFNTRKLPLTDSNNTHPHNPQGQFQQKPSATQDKDPRSLSQLEAERKRREQELAYQQQQMMRREEERRLKDKEERERNEKEAAKKLTKEEKKQLKQQAKQEKQEFYAKEQSEEREVAATVAVAKPRGRVRNIITFIIALLGLYFILLPSQIDFMHLNFFMTNYVVDEGLTVGLTGWDIIIGAITPFMPAASNMSPAIASLVDLGCSLNYLSLLITAIVGIILVIVLLIYLVSKFIGIITGNGHRGLDILALVCAAVSLLGFIYLMFISGNKSLAWGLPIITPFGVFLVIMLVNSIFGKKKSKKVKSKETHEPAPQPRPQQQQQQLTPAQIQQMQMQKIQAQVQQQRMQQQQNPNQNQNGR